MDCVFQVRQEFLQNFEKDMFKINQEQSPYCWLDFLQECSYSIVAFDTQVSLYHGDSKKLHRNPMMLSLGST